jgi:signal transduction histidine kinase
MLDESTSTDDRAASSARALLRVATLVAEGADPERLFGEIAAEASGVLGVGAVTVMAYDADARMFTEIAAPRHPRPLAVSEDQRSRDRSRLGGLILKTGQPARIDDWPPISGLIAARHAGEGFGQAVGAPIVVDGVIWGFIGASGEAGELLPPECEARLSDFARLMAIAIANAQARENLRGLVESQTALRRVATLVAQGAEPKNVFATVAVEAARILGVDAVSLISYDPGTRMFTKIYGTHGQRASVPDGGRWSLENCPEGALILETGGPVRIDDWTDVPGPVAARHRADGFGQAVAAPIVVDGTIWGHIAAFGEADEKLAPGCETRLADFTNLMASALANTQARDKLRGLAEQQGAALRRVATLVAEQALPSTIFNAVAREASAALGVPRVDVARRQEDGSVALVGSTGRGAPPTDQRLTKRAARVAAAVMATLRPARIDDHHVSASSTEGEGDDGLRSIVGAPILVDGSLWGMIVVLAEEVLHRDTETKLTDFTHLVASSISNRHARTNLIASRARIVTASDETRRRIERNLHDGIQQRVVALGLKLRAVRERLPSSADVQAGLDEVADDLDGLLEEVRVFSQGLHPALLSRAGLLPSLRALKRRSPVPVELALAPVPRLPEPIETAIYYVVSEALANVAKHSRASGVTVSVAHDRAAVRVTVADDGVGGAALAGSSGLIGLVDRVEALGGRFNLDSPAGRGTTIMIELGLVSDRVGDEPTL